MKSKKILFLVAEMALALLLSPFTTPAQSGPVTDSVEMGASYANEVYYSMSDGFISSHDRNTWDIAFRTMKMSSSILTNDGRGVVLYTYPKSDTSGWASVDTSGLSLWTPMYNDPDDWENGAFSRYALGHPDYGWCVYNTVTHNLVGDSLFIIKLRDGNFKKLWVMEKKSVLDIYVFRYADLDGSNEQNIQMDCNPYLSKDFVGFNMISGTVEDFQPPKNAWDVVFTKYMSVQTNGQPYGVTGVLSNDNVKEKEFRGVDPLTYVNFSPGPWDSTRSSIGYDWKYLDGNFAYHMVDSLVYFVMNGDGHVFKLYFTLFTGGAGGATGKVVFVKEQMTGVGVPVRKGLTGAVTVYPNPVRDRINLSITGDFNEPMEYFLSDFSGKEVLSGVLIPATGSASIPAMNIAPGMYLLKFVSGSGTDIKKVIISR